MKKSVDFVATPVYSFFGRSPMESEMFQQTVDLCKSLPNLAPWIKAADRKGTSKWEIVRWKAVEPHRVTPAVIRPLSQPELCGEAERNLFESRTDALRTSERITKKHKPSRSEREHWGVWRWNENGETFFQTALPVNRPDNALTQSKCSTDSNTLTGTMVRLNEPAYRMLRRRAAEEGMTLQSTLEAAIDMYDNQRFFDRANESFAAMRANPDLWDEELAERKEWDATLSDGIEEDAYSSAITQAEGTGSRQKVA